jgi:AcrR family transcriptional regulator
MPTMESHRSDHRKRLMDAMARNVAEKGYVAVTIADLAAEARVSKRSFYEQFRDKSDCFIELYELASLQALKVVQEALDPQRDWHDQVEHVLGAYLHGLARKPALLPTLFIDIMALGASGLAARRRATRRLADFIVEAAGGGVGHKEAVAVVGGLHEWVLEAAEDGHFDRLPLLAPAGARLMRALTQNTQPA